MKQTTIHMSYSANSQDKHYGIEDIAWWFLYRVEINRNDGKIIS